MTSNNPDLSDLIKHNQQLEKENAKLKATVTDAIHSLRNGKIPSALSVLEMATWLSPEQASAAVEAPKPKFQVGDYVLVDFYGIDKTIRRQARVTAIEKAMKYGDEIDVYRVWFDGSEAPAETTFEEGRIRINPYLPKDE